MSRLHPDDLAEARKRASAPMAPGMWIIGGAGALVAMAEIAAALEPQLIFQTDGDRVSWNQALAQLRFRLDQWRYLGTSAGGVEPSILDDLVAIASRSWRGPGRGPRRALPFVVNADLRRIAERDLASLTVALAAEETKSALVLAGSVIEAILTDLLEARSPAWIDGKKSFFQIIEMCGPKGLRVLDERTVKVADTVRDTRNFVHPGRERETLQGRDFARSEGIVAQALVEQVIEAVAAAAATRP